MLFFCCFTVATVAIFVHNCCFLLLLLLLTLGFNFIVSFLIYIFIQLHLVLFYLLIYLRVFLILFQLPFFLRLFSKKKKLKGKTEVAFHKKEQIVNQSNDHLTEKYYASAI